MKRILGITALVSFFVFMAWALSYAVAPDVWLSSNTATADATQNLCKGVNYLVGTSTNIYGNHGVLHAVCVGIGVAGSSVTVYNSSGTALNPITVVSASTPTVCSTFDVSVSSGLTYSNSSTANVTILYQCY